ncbi:MAG: cyanophycinase [Ginsengibacter sp.]
MIHKLIFLWLASLFSLGVFGQEAKGNLFIIGGGDRSPQLIKKLISTAQLASKDYIVILPMATSEPDTAYYYIKRQLEEACHNSIANLNFEKKDTANNLWLDSVKHAKLIFITGGDQGRFMNVVLHSPIQEAIRTAYSNGATVAGTSAGAAVMPMHMITGEHLLGDTTYYSTFKELRNSNIEIIEGLGLLTSAIIDQHFIVRSRYNRLLSALAKYPALPCIGIDESTAIIIHGVRVEIAGEGQVVVFSKAINLRATEDGYIKFDDVHMSIFTNGDKFNLTK